MEGGPTAHRAAVRGAPWCWQTAELATPQWRGWTGLPATPAGGHHSLKSTHIQQECLLGPRTSLLSTHLDSQAQQVQGVPQGHAANNGARLGRLSTPHPGATSSLQEPLTLPVAVLSIAQRIPFIPTANCLARLVGPSDHGEEKTQPATTATDREAQLRGAQLFCWGVFSSS